MSKAAAKILPTFAAVMSDIIAISDEERHTGEPQATYQSQCRTVAPLSARAMK